MATEKETIILDFQVDTTEAVTSIESLTKANKELREERKSLDVTTKDGKARIEEINKSLDANNKVIKENSSALEKSRLNVGNYASALDKVVPGLGGMAQGFAQGTKAALAFIATGIGAVIAAVGLSIGALTAYFKGSEEGQNKWNKVVSIGTALFEKYMDLVEAYGELVYRVFTEPRKVAEEFWNFIAEDLTGSFEALGKIFKGIFTFDFGLIKEGSDQAAQIVANSVKLISDTVKGVIKDIEGAVDAGQRMAELNAELDRQERELIVERAKTSLEVSKLRQEAVTQEGEIKRNTLLEAIALEQALSDKEVEHANTKLELANQELETNGADKEAKDKVAEATAGVIKAEQLRYDNTLKFSKEIQAIDEAEAKRREKYATDYGNLIIKLTQLSIDKSKQGFEERKKVAVQELNTTKEIKDSETEVYLGTFEAIGGAFKSYAGKNKAVSRSLALVDAGLAISRIFAAPAVPFIEPWSTITRISQAVIASANTARAFGLIDKAAGGGSFLTKGPQLLMVGDNPGGVERVDVTPISGSGTTSVGSGFIKLAGGGTVFSDGVTVANSMTSGMTDFSSMDDRPIQVSVKEIREVMDMVDRKVSVVEA